MSVDAPSMRATHDPYAQRARDNAMGGFRVVDDGVEPLHDVPLAGR
jgi:hypothetical protein